RGRVVVAAPTGTGQLLPWDEDGQQGREGDGGDGPTAPSGRRPAHRLPGDLPGRARRPLVVLRPARGPPRGGMATGCGVTSGRSDALARCRRGRTSSALPPPATGAGRSCPLEVTLPLGDLPCPLAEPAGQAAPDVARGGHPEWL